MGTQELLFGQKSLYDIKNIIPPKIRILKNISHFFAHVSYFVYAYMTYFFQMDPGTN